MRLIANLVLIWLLLLLPCAAALDLSQAQPLLPACCRTHGAHHCSMAAAAVASQPSIPEWRGPGCPFAHLLHPALLLPPYLSARQLLLVARRQAESSPTAEVCLRPCSPVRLPRPRGPPLST